MARAGDVIGGKYRLIHPLGIGGMGAVWRAEHLALKQQVAIKLLDARGPAAERSVARFQREAQIAASIRHRNIVYISDFGTDRGMPYLVMELLSGVPLSERLVVGEPLSVASFLAYIAEILQGLGAVHAAGVVHRDMKPENIFLVRDGAAVLPKLLDFGVSRSTDRDAGHTITREGIVMGTPEYIAPEQARGRMADMRSDLYSLGVVIYEAIAGRLPFQADNAADLIVAVLNAQPIPLLSLRPDIGEPLSVLVHKAMARRPDLRFQTATEMHAAIGDYLAANPQAEDRSLPRRYIAHIRTLPAPSSPPVPLTPTEGEIYATHASGSSLEDIPGLRRRDPKVTAIALGALAALLAVLVLVIADGAPPSAASPANVSAAIRAQPAPVAAVVPGPVRVELFGVPKDGTVLLDGREITGSTIELPRNSGLHSIEVHAKGRTPWHVSHDASADGRYALVLEPEPPPSSRHQRRSKEAVNTQTGPARPNKSSLVRKPDF